MTASSGEAVSAAATLQHIEKLHAQVLKLEALRIEAEEQLLHRIGNDYRAGRLSAEELIEVYERYKATRISGRTTRWNEAVPVPWLRMPKLSLWQPNGPAGTWVGTWPMSDGASVPAPYQPVVYVLFDEASEPIYVGSTGDLRIRLKAHAKQHKPFVRWQAYAAADREAAYQLETKLLREHKPSLNKRAGR